MTGANIKPVLEPDLERLYFVALHDIPAGTQLLYDYNEDDPEVLEQEEASFLRRPPPKHVQGTLHKRVLFLA